MRTTPLPPDAAALLERCKQARQLNRLSIAAVATEAGMRKATVSNQFSGYFNLDIRVVLAVARMCPNVSAEYLLRGQGDIIRDGDSRQYAEIIDRIEKIEQTMNNIAKT